MALETPGPLLVTFVLLLVRPLSATNRNLDLVKWDARQGEYYNIFLEGEFINFIPGVQTFTSFKIY